jgi:hypothetical protein
MSFTLADFSRLATQPLKKAVIDIFRRESFMLETLSFETPGTLNIEMLRTKTLPTITAREIGESYTESKGDTENLQERVAFLGGYIDIPKEYIKAKNQVVNQRALQTEMFVTSMAYKFNDMFINGNPITNDKEMVGLHYRFNNDLDSAQSIDAGGIDISSDGGSLAAAQATLIDKIEELIHSVDGHKADVLLMNSTLYLRLLSALRALSYYASTKDTFGRSLATFGEGGAKIVDIGVKKDQSTLIMPNTELANGTATTGATFTSIYALKTGDPYLKGWQFDNIDTVDMGLLENGVSYRTIIDWGVGMYFYNPRSVSRLYNIQAA